MLDQKLSSSIIDLTEADIARRQAFVDLGSADLTRIAAVKTTVLQHLDEHVGAFFDFLAPIEEARGLFRTPSLLEEARRLKRMHLMAMVQGGYGRGYMDERLQLCELYRRAFLDVRVFLGGYHCLVTSVGRRVMEQFPKDAKAGFEHLASLKKITYIDIALVVDAMVSDRETTIARQQDAIRELSTPTLQIRDRLLIMPIVGLMDSHRAKQLTDGLLNAIRANRAKVVVMDVTGMATIDSRVANHFIQTVAAARLMGAKVIVTGLSADVAQSMVVLGVDLSSLNTVGDLQGGLEEAERSLGYKVVRIQDAPPPAAAA